MSKGALNIARIAGRRVVKAHALKNAASRKRVERTASKAYRRALREEALMEQSQSEVKT